MRRGPSLKRKADPDPIYNSVLVSQIINQVLLDGKKDLASGIVYSALELVQKQSGSDPINVLKDAFENIKSVFRNFSSKLEIKDIHFIPISALNGDNVVDRSKNMDWYEGVTLMHLLENIHIGSDHNHVDCRFPVQ